MTVTETTTMEDDDDDTSTTDGSGGPSPPPPPPPPPSSTTPARGLRGKIGVLNDFIFLSEITIFVGFPTKWSRWYFSEWSWLDLLVAFKVRYPTLFLAFPSWFWHHYCLVGCFIFVVLCRRDATRRDKSIYPFIYAAIHASIYWFYHSLSLSTHMHMYMYIYITCICICTCTCIRIRICMYMYMYM